jgi:hypothetical protein
MFDGRSAIRRGYGLRRSHGNYSWLCGRRFKRGKWILRWNCVKHCLLSVHI